MTEAILTTTTREPIILAKNVSFEDYLKKFDGQRTEWLAGKVIQKVSNNHQHNILLFFMSRLFMQYLEQTNKRTLLQAGVAMFISDDVPAREPDIMIVLLEHFDRIKPTHFEGPADIAVEIVSPGSASMDRGDKFVEYEAAGVPEYWLLDPIRKAADIYVLDAEDHYQRAGLDDKGWLVSSVLPGLGLDPEILWRDELPTGQAIVELVEGMVKAEK